jgi:malate dehydrogenase (oxaloacetate-decarboxylating)(NADP+)
MLRTMMDDQEKLKQQALEYHALPTPGKIAISVTKPMDPQSLNFAYTPGVAEPVRAIAKDPKAAYQYTNKGNLVAVITNGSAILGLGNLGPLASKPVMEGKAALFKHLAQVDAIDLEIDADTPEAMIDTVSRLAPSFGGINLEDIKAPDCFLIEQTLQQRLNIPVFHDDQHGTAIVIAAALKNALTLQQKNLKDCKIVCIGSGAAGIASMNFLRDLGANKQNMRLIDRGGVIHDGRKNLNPYKQAFAINTTDHTLEQAMEQADVVIGLAGPGLINESMLKSMADKPIIFVLSNPDPEINPVTAKKARPDSIIATGRSDLPNQVNNVLCFPYMFRAALDRRASCITLPMKQAASDALALLAQNNPEQKLSAEYIIPAPQDPRLAETVVTAIMKACKDPC